MTGSKGSLKERIFLLAKKPKTAILTLLAVLLLAALAVGCTFTGAKEEKPDNQPSTPDAATVTTAPPETTAPPTQQPTEPPTQEWVPTEPFTPGVSLWYEAAYERPNGGLSYTGDSKRRVRIPKIEMPGPYVEEINEYIWRAYNTNELYVYSDSCDIDYHAYLTQDYLVLVIYAKDLLEENQDSDGCQAFVIDLETCREASAQEILGDMTQEEFLKQAKRTAYNQFLLDYTYIIGEGKFPIESRKEYYSILNYRYEEDKSMAVPVPGEDGTLWMVATILTMAGQGSRSDFLPLEIQQQSPCLEEVLASFAE